MNLFKATLLKVAYTAPEALRAQWEERLQNADRSQQMYVPNQASPTTAGGMPSMVENPDYANPYADENNRWTWKGRGLYGFGRDVANAAGAAIGEGVRHVNMAFNPFTVASTVSGAIGDVTHNLGRNYDYYLNNFLHGDPQGAKHYSYVDSGASPFSERKGNGFTTGNQGFWGQLGTGFEGIARDTIEPARRAMNKGTAPTLQNPEQAQPGQSFWIESSKAPAQHPWQRRGLSTYENRSAGPGAAPQIKTVEPVSLLPSFLRPSMPQYSAPGAAPVKKAAAVETPAAATSPATPVAGVQEAGDLAAPAAPPSTAESSGNMAMTQGADATGGLPKASGWFSDKLGELSARQGWMKGSPYKMDFSHRAVTGRDPTHPVYRTLFDPGTTFGHTKGVVPQMLRASMFFPQAGASLLTRAALPPVLATLDKARGVEGSWKQRMASYTAGAFRSPAAREAGLTPEQEYILNRVRARGLDPSSSSTGVGGTLRNLGMEVGNSFGPSLNLLGNQARHFWNAPR